MSNKIFQFISQLWSNKINRARVLPVAIIVVALLIILVFKLLQPQPPVKVVAEKVWVVQTHQLSAGKKIPQLKLYGRVESPYMSVLTASISADVKTLQVHEGDYVSQGQILLHLDNKDVQLALDENNANVAELEALINAENNRYKNDQVALKLEKSLVALAEKKLSREIKTSRSKLTSLSSRDTQQQALDKQKLALVSRQLAVADHAARLAQLQARLSRQQARAQKAAHDAQRAVIVAPFNGIITKTEVSPGEFVRPGEALLDMYDTAQVEIRAQLPNVFVAIVKQALAQHIPLTASLKTDHGSPFIHLDRLSGLIGGSGGGVDGLFTLSEKQSAPLTIGQVLELTLDLPPLSHVYSVPVSSIYGTERLYQVVNNRLVRVRVKKVGNQYRAGKQFVLVASDKLKPGDRVITTQLPQAVNGLKVKWQNNAPVNHASVRSLSDQ